MTYSPAIAVKGTGQIVATTTIEALGIECATTQSGMTSQNWVTANLVVYVPFQLAEPATVTKLWWGNGAAVAGNIDVGIYDFNGNLLVSTGSTAQATISGAQTVDVTDTGLGRGRYYFGMVSDTSGATQKVMANLGVAALWQSFGLLQQASVTLPLATNASPATFAKYASSFCPQVGLLASRVLSL